MLIKVLAHNQNLIEENQKIVKQNQKLANQVQQLTQQVAELKKNRIKNSRNSNQPPSQDKLGERQKIRKKKKPTGRKQGGQKGHKGHYLTVNLHQLTR